MTDRSGNPAPAAEFNVKDWVDARGEPTAPVTLASLGDRFKVLYCFQSWCPGCHSKGFPDLKKMVEALPDSNRVAFLAVQTVFEGFDTNTYDAMLETRGKYQIPIPFGHDAGDDGNSRSNLMRAYCTGGTPWFIFINPENRVVFSDFHLDPDAAIEYLRGYA